MSSFSPQFQIISDLHLETPLAAPAYSYFAGRSHFSLHASNLFLLGDIGLIRHNKLFDFIDSLLDRTPNLRIFYVLGNHEAYGITMPAALAAMCRYEEFSKRKFGERFFFMDRRRVDFSPTVTILGCTLWSRIEDEQADKCTQMLTDFHETNGIRDRTCESHNEDHMRDLTWLNKEVATMSSTEPERQIVILTHHSPTTDPRANDPVHAESELSSGFRTDLSREVCWTSGNVKMWAFGHTHWSCSYTDESAKGGKKLVVSEQKGYAYPEGKGNWKVRPLVVEAGRIGEQWKVVLGGVGRRDDEEYVQGIEKPRIGVGGQVSQPERKGKGSVKSKSLLGRFWSLH
jgi:hypothetical protein